MSTGVCCWCLLFVAVDVAVVAAARYCCCWSCVLFCLFLVVLFVGGVVVAVC